MTVTERAKQIKLLIMDCDGVLTDGRLYFSAAGEELKVFHARDGQGIVEWHKAGFRSGIISGRNSPIVEMRAKQLGIEFVFQGRKEKVSALNEMILEAGVLREETAFVGDDTPDAEVFPFVGLAVAVGDAHDAVKSTAHHITVLDGGRGAVREVIDMLLDARK
ncbi:MAG: HAD hydrolase family protein [Chloracidobacterium sp.]|nr:HAD hydrolase family protein [Chloracidobacterium sp.]